MSHLVAQLDRGIRVVLALVLLGVLWVAWALLTEPSVETQLPPETLFESPTPEGSALALDSVDFVFRPLFAADRRPPEDLSAPLEVEDASEEAAAEWRLDGVNLIGVFASGDAQGAILRKTDGTRFRLTEGEEVDGWRLQRVEPRAAVFASGSGGGLVEDRIEMSVVSLVGPSQPVRESARKRSSSTSLGLSPASVREAKSASSANNPQTERAAGDAGSDEAQQAEPAEASAPTFDSIYKKRAPRGAPRDSGSDTNR